jgi:replicative DNA helicase
VNNAINGEMQLLNEAEQAVLGSLILDNNLLLEVAQILEVDDFFNPLHQGIYGAINDLKKLDVAFDEVTIADKLGLDFLRPYGGPTVLHEFIDFVPTSNNVVHYSNIVQKKGHERKHLSLTVKLQKDIKESGAKEAFQVYSIECQKLLSKTIKQENESVAEIIPRFWNLLEKRSSTDGVTGLKTGLDVYDDLILGLDGGQLHVIAARPKVGKSALALSFVNHVSNTQGRVLFFSVEMSKDEIMERYLSLNTKIDSRKFKTGDFEGDDWDKMAMVANNANDHKDLIINDDAGVTINDIILNTEYEHSKAPLKLLVVDYLQRVRPTNPKMPREQQVAEISWGLKLIAKKLDIPVIVLAQLNREGAKANDEPKIHMLRESGAIEQDANSVTFLHKPESDDPRELELIVAANRSGPTGKHGLMLNGATSKFRSVALKQKYDE